MELTVTFTIDDVRDQAAGINILGRLLGEFPDAELGQIYVDGEPVDDDLDGIFT